MRAGDGLTTPADLCAQIGDYWSRLEELVPELSVSTGAGTTGYVSVRVADAPFPGNAAAFAALMVIWEAIPRLEASLRLAGPAGHPGLRRHGDQGFLAALKEIPRQAAGLEDEDGEALAARVLEWLVNVARAVPDIDEAQRWRHVRGRACPYCKCVTTLKVLLDARGRPTGHVECFASPRASGERCLDRDGLRPVATIDASAVPPKLRWNDGLTETAPDLEG
jgi:hypothetical protein